MAEILILGAGGFGTALAIMCAQNGHDVTLYSPFQEEIETLSTAREHKKLLPGVKIPQAVHMVWELPETVGAPLAVVATPSFAVRGVCASIKGRIGRDTVVTCVSKGFETGTLKTLRIYVNDDVTGVELGGALKNVIALAAGTADGLGLGDNSKAALMTRGITEIARLGVAMGASTETFAGLSGIGDLIVTCTSMHSRNRRAGILIGQGKTAQEAIDEVGMTVEGYTAAKCAWELAQRAGVEMPIIREVYAVLYEGKRSDAAIRDLMGRPKRHESEVIWLLSR